MTRKRMMGNGRGTCLFVFFMEGQGSGLCKLFLFIEVMLCHTKQPSSS